MLIVIAMLQHMFLLLMSYLLTFIVSNNSLKTRDTSTNKTSVFIVLRYTPIRMLCLLLITRDGSAPSGIFSSIDIPVI